VLHGPAVPPYERQVEARPAWSVRDGRNEETVPASVVGSAPTESDGERREEDRGIEQDTNKRTKKGRVREQRVDVAVSIAGIVDMVVGVTTTHRSDSYACHRTNHPESPYKYPHCPMWR
jgi:hypothetical protein